MTSFDSDRIMDSDMSAPSSGQLAERRQVPDVRVQNFAGLPESTTSNVVNLPTEMELEPLHSIVPRYHVSSYVQYPNSILGTGSFATALKVFSQIVGTAVVKINNQPVVSSRGSTGGKTTDEVNKRRREFFNCFLLNNHPNIVALYGYIYDTDREHPVGILMEYMAGGTVLDYIRHYLQDPGLYPLPEILRNTWSKQLSMGLKFMHEKRIAHRDIKPNNLLLTADFRTAKIADFGLAKNLEQSGNKHTRGIGNWMYSAPEQIMGNVYDYPVDCYSFGMVLYFIYYQRHPFDEDSKKSDLAFYKALKGEEQPPLRPQLRTQRGPIDEIIERCWQSDPQDRFTMSEIVHRFYSADGIRTFPAYDV